MNRYEVTNTAGDISFGFLNCDAELPTTGTRPERRAAAMRNAPLVKCLEDAISKHPLVGFKVRVTQITPQRNGQKLSVGYTQDNTPPTAPARKQAPVTPPPAPVAAVQATPAAKAPATKRGPNLSRNEKVVATMLKKLDAKRREVVLSTVR